MGMTKDTTERLGTILALHEAEGHLTQQQVAEVAADVATPEDKESADLHVGGCVRCRRAVEERVGMLNELEGTLNVEMFAATRARVHAMMRSELPLLERPEPTGAEVLGAGIVHWLGRLSTWSQLPVVADVPLGQTLPTYAAVQSDLEALFPLAVLEQELAWATGPLRIAAAYDDVGGIRSMRVSVSVRSDGRGTMFLDVADSEGHDIAFELTSERPFDGRSAPDLRGRLQDLSLRLRTAMPE